ncbi:protein NLP6-like isoform X1 [Prunus avium]|uniref:Protein NLP6-like isoform X1 n=2 Tax=Prunus avium TaxID=42229 RepID=A0A6P5TLD6_PRUAV|nr:protein NLP6-like isoform X1 [Prunus avium]
MLFGRWIRFTFLLTPSPLLYRVVMLIMMISSLAKLIKLFLTVLNSVPIQICNEGRQTALTEILEILTVVCETHKLPLAQTWVPCMHHNVLAYGGSLKKNCTCFDGSCMEQVCMSTTDAAFYIVDAPMWHFREACVEHHLQKGQGVAGRAFLSHNACFCRDITQFCKTDYPLVHYARMFKLTSCFAICLQSTHTGNDDYILEFFLPPSITDSYEQQTLLGSLLAIIKNHFQSLKVASGIILEEEGLVEMVQASTNKGLDSRLECIRIPCSAETPPGPALPNGEEMVQLDSSKPQLMVDFDPANDGSNAVDEGGANNISCPENNDNREQPQQDGSFFQLVLNTPRALAASMGPHPSAYMHFSDPHP